MKICERNCSKRTCEAAFGDLLHTELVNPRVEHIAGTVILDSWDQVRVFLHADREPELELLNDIGPWVIGKEFFPLGDVQLRVSKRDPCTLKIVGVSRIVWPWGSYKPVQR